MLRLLLKDESVFPEEAPLRQEEFSSPLLGRVFDRLWQLRQEGRPLSVAGLSGELSGEEMSHLTGVLQKPEPRPRPSGRWRIIYASSGRRRRSGTHRAIPFWRLRRSIKKKRVTEESKHE